MKRLLLLSLALCACTHRTAVGGDPSLQVYAGSELPAPTPSDQVADNMRPTIAGTDQLSINVFGVPELSLQEVQVDATGRFSMPLIGEVQAGGHTTDEVAREIEARLRGRFVRNPQVSVNLHESRGQLVTVGGEVRQPGIYPVIPRMTLLGAITRAQGFSEFARRQDVIIFRTVRGQRLAALYNVAAIQRGAYADPVVYANDIVMVGDSPGRRLFRDILQAAPAILSPLVYIVR